MLSNYRIFDLLINLCKFNVDIILRENFIKYIDLDFSLIIAAEHDHP